MLRIQTFFKLNLIFTFLLLLNTSLCLAEQQPIVKIGLIYPLTGTMSSFGQDMALALPLLEKKFNRENSKYKFELSIEDGKFGQTNAAISAAHKFVDVDQIKFIVVGSSGEALQVAPFLESSKVLTVAGFASHPKISDAGDYIFRTYVNSDRGIAFVVDHLKQSKLSRLAVLTEQSSFTEAIRDSLTTRFKDNIVFSEDFESGSDLKTIITKARSKKPDAYYLNSTSPANFINLYKQLRESGAKEPFYTFYVPSVKEVQETLGTLLDGCYYLDFPDNFKSSDDYEKFILEFKQATGQDLKAPFNFRTNYNAIKAVYDAIIAIGPDPHLAKDYLYKYDQPGAVGQLRFDSKGDAIDVNLSLKQYASTATHPK